MRTVLLICFTESHLNNEESLFFSTSSSEHLGHPTTGKVRWTVVLPPKNHHIKLFKPLLFFISTKTEPNPEITALTRHIFRLICKWLEIQRFGVAILGRIHLIRFLHSRSEFSFGTVHIPLEYEATYRALHLYFYFFGLLIVVNSWGASKR